MSKRRQTIDWEMEIDGLHIPGICLPQDMLEINVDIDYNYTPKIPSRGMFGRPENASPAENAEVELLDHEVKTITCKSENGKERKIYYDYLIRQQQEIIDEAIDEMTLEQEDDIEEKIRDQEEK